MTKLIKAALSLSIIAVLTASIITSMPAEAFFGSKNKSKKPTSRIEFTITKHGGLHTVNGGFKVVKQKGNLVEVNINSLWTWQNDSKASDDPARTKDLLTSDWFDAKKFPKATFKADINNKKFIGGILTIKGISKRVELKKSGKFLKINIKLNDFNVDASWKKVFAGDNVNVTIKL